jgi:uncharacterized SAM-binding protein YcdF (DUF218 family)
VDELVHVEIISLDQLLQKFLFLFGILAFLGKLLLPLQDAHLVHVYLIRVQVVAVFLQDTRDILHILDQVVPLTAVDPFNDRQLDRLLRAAPASHSVFQAR